MKTIFCLLMSMLAVLSLTSCATPKHKPAKTVDTPETVVVVYQVRSGREADLKELLDRAWKVYQREHMVHAQPHVIVQETTPDGKAKITEIFTWVSHKAPEQAPAQVAEIWNEMQAMCESRNGQPGLGGGEVQLIEPR